MRDVPHGAMRVHSETGLFRLGLHSTLCIVVAGLSLTACGPAESGSVDSLARRLRDAATSDATADTGSVTAIQDSGSLGSDAGATSTDDATLNDDAMIAIAADTGAETSILVEASADTSSSSIVDANTGETTATTDASVDSGASTSTDASADAAGTTSISYILRRQTGPDRTEVLDASGHLLATFTDGASTVVLTGAMRTFAESTAANPVQTPDWVRVLPAPFHGVVDFAWLERARVDTSADVLAIGMQYVLGAPALYDSSGLQYAGDADYGPLLADGTRQEGSDFNDYLGVSWTYPTSVDAPETTQIHSLDCSGFIRVVWGYRSGLPLTLSPDGTSIPRRSFEIADSAPGIVTIPDTLVQVTDFTHLAAGDLVFFDADSTDGTRIDHTGIYLGIDTGGHRRFLSSRKSANGPTLGDTSGRSILDGTGYYATAFRAARRF